MPIGFNKIYFLIFRLAAAVGPFLKEINVFVYYRTTPGLSVWFWEIK